jgi:hypothetical protein
MVYTGSNPYLLHQQHGHFANQLQLQLQLQLHNVERPHYPASFTPPKTPRIAGCNTTRAHARPSMVDVQGFKDAVKAWAASGSYKIVEAGAWLGVMILNDPVGASGFLNNMLAMVPKRLAFDREGDGQDGASVCLQLGFQLAVDAAGRTEGVMVVLLGDALFCKTCRRILVREDLHKFGFALEGDKRVLDDGLGLALSGMLDVQHEAEPARGQGVQPIQGRSGTAARGVRR